MEFLNLKEFASTSRISLPTASKKLKENNISHFKRGNKIFIPQLSLEIPNIKNVISNNNKEIPIISIVNNKGGVGKTTTAIHLATSYAFYGFNVLLVDNDTQGNASGINDAHIHNDFMNHNLTSLLLKLDELTNNEIEEEIKKTVKNITNPNMELNGKIDLLPNSYVMESEIDRFTLQGGSETLLDRLLKKLKSKYDIIIIDNSPKLDISFRMSVLASNAILINLSPIFYSLQGINGIIRSIKRINGAYYDRHGKDIHILGAVITDFHTVSNADKVNIEMIEEKLFEIQKINVIKPYIHRSNTAKNAQLLGGSAIYSEPVSNFNGQYLNLSVNILKAYYNIEG